MMQKYVGIKTRFIKNFMSDYYNYVKEGNAGRKVANGLFSKVQIMI